MKSGGTRVVVGAARQGMGRELLPCLGRETGDEHIVRSRELPADFRDLAGALAVGENDLGKSDAPETVEIEREVLAHERNLTGDRRFRLQSRDLAISRSIKPSTYLEIELRSDCAFLFSCNRERERSPRGALCSLRLRRIVLPLRSSLHSIRRREAGETPARPPPL